MRIAALIFGLLAGLAAGLMLAIGDTETYLAALPIFAPRGALVARLLVYFVPAIGWIGTGLVLARPRLGGLLLLLSAAGWAALAFAAGHGTILFAAPPFTFALAAGVVAMFRRRPAASAEVDRQSARPAPVGAPDRLPPRRLAESAPPPAHRGKLQTATARTRIVEAPADPVEAPLAPRIPPPFRDDVAMDDAAMEEVAPNKVATDDATIDEVAMEDAPPAGVPAGVPEGEPVAPIAAAIATLTVPPVATATADVGAPVPPKAPMAEPERAGDVSAAEAGPGAPTAAIREATPEETAPSADPDAAALRARRPGDWSLPTPATPSRTRYVAEQQSVPLARTTSVSVAIEPGTVDAPQRLLPLEPVAAAIAPAAATVPASAPEPVSPPPPNAEASAEAGDLSAAALDFAPADDYGRGSPPVPERSEPAVISTARERLRQRPPRDADAASAARPPRRHGGVRAILRGVIAAAFVVVVLGGAGAIYFDYLRGPHSLLFGHRSAATHPTAPAAKAPPAAKPATPAKAAQPSAQPEKTSVSPSPVAAAALPVAATASAATPTAPPPAPAATAQADPPAAPAAAAPAALTFTDPVRYCATVQTIDAPDSHYTGPAVPPAVATALLLPISTPANQVHWRCAGGIALACNANGTHACDPTPTVQQMLDYCAKHPGASAMPAPNGSWSCNGTRPVIPENQSWPVDARGFYPNAWVRVSPIGAG